MAMWVKCSDRSHFEERLKVAMVTREMMVNFGVHHSWTRSLLDAPDFNEAFLRKILQHHYDGDTEKWQLHVVCYNAEYDALDVVVSSPDFPPIQPGNRLERLQQIDTLPRPLAVESSNAG